MEPERRRHRARTVDGAVMREEREGRRAGKPGAALQRLRSGWSACSLDQRREVRRMAAKRSPRGRANVATKAVTRVAA